MMRVRNAHQYIGLVAVVVVGVGCRRSRRSTRMTHVQIDLGFYHYYRFRTSSSGNSTGSDIITTIHIIFIIIFKAIVWMKDGR